MLTSRFSLQLLFATQHILHKWCLASGWTMPAAKGIQKRIPMLNEKWSQYGGRLSNRHTGGVVSIGAAGPMIEQNSRKRASAGRFPQIPVQAKLSTRKLDDLRRHRLQ